MTAVYLIPLAAWLTFIYAQRHHGDRPTTHTWWALLSGLGTVECTKGLASLWMPADAALVVSVCCGLFVAAAIGLLAERDRLAELAASEANEAGLADSLRA